MSSHVKYVSESYRAKEYKTLAEQTSRRTYYKKFRQNFYES
jgi:hypothetical protein